MDASFPAILGDFHGHWDEYLYIIKQFPKTICVGDFGFQTMWDKLHSLNDPNHLINMGNHDYLPYLHLSQNSLGDWSYLSEYDIFTVRGAYSRDKEMRTLNVDWFENEELTYKEGDTVLEAYTAIRP